MSGSELSFTTGISGLDAMLHGLKPGDNVVLQVGTIEEYIPFVEPYYRACLDAGIPLIYFRFARHRELVSAASGAEVYHLHPEAGFERFITEILDVIERAGRGACYVFDCLSELAVDWYSDRMLGNFFMVTCPYLYKLDTIAYFALYRNHHSSLAIDAITDTAQVVMTIYSNREQVYVQPLKVDTRYSPTMYMLNRWEGDTFRPVFNSAVTAEVLSETPQPWLEFSIHRPEVWTRTFTEAKQALDSLGSSEPVDAAELERLYMRLLRMAITREEKFIGLAREYFSLSGLVSIVQRMIGTGLIGGKSLGMLLARAILEKRDPAWCEKLEQHDSFFIGSDVFYTYLVQNACWWLRRRHKGISMEQLLGNAAQARERILSGRFPADVRHQFMEMLNYFGQSPIIVRSSSLLEDNYGNAFSGKYESVFCANQGTPEARLDELMQAVRTVYASTMSRDALTYRADRGLLDQDEQMALLVQRVSGSNYSGLFFPQLGGVGFSFNPYVWNSDIDPKVGLLRLVFGLGTRAVDRTEDDYTRLIALNMPLQQPEDSAEDARRYSQRYVDVLDLEANRLLTRPIDDALKMVPDATRKFFVSRDYELETLARERNLKNVFPWRLDFDRIIRETSFVDDMREMLRILQEAYNYPVDVEFTANFPDNGICLLNLVQCRPFQVQVDIDGSLAQPGESLSAEDMVLESCGPVIGPGLATDIDRVVYVVPEEYAKLPVQSRYAVARLIGQITHLEGAEKRQNIMLIGPGRWGTRSPSLGVPVRFAEISRATVLCELALMHAGLVPDVSLGTHFFNDLVEMGMICLAVFPERQHNCFNQDVLERAANRLLELLPEASEWAHVLRVVDGDRLGVGKRLYLRADPMRQEAACYVAQADAARK